MAEDNQSDSSGANGASASPDSGVTQEQLDKAKNDYLYLRAEFENYKKHAIKERSEISKFGAERLTRDLLGVLDNFERALSVNVTADTFQNFRQGVEMTAAELRNVLQRHGVTEVEALGSNFDPNLHEAVASEVSATANPGSVLRVFQKAYRLHDKLLRPAQVVVAKRTE